MTRSRARSLLVAWLHLGALWAFAVAQPLLDLLGDTPEFFVARGNTRADILLVAFAITLVPPALMAAAEVAVSPWPRVRRALHLTLVALLAATIALQVVKDVAGSAISIGLALALGAAVALAYARMDGVRTFVTVLSPAPVLFVAYFLLISPVSELVLPQESAQAGTDRGSGAPVVMLVLDELSGESLLDRGGGIDSARYPGFAALARGTTWYRNATSVDYATERAVPAVLTGAQPAWDSLPIASDHPRSLFTMLARRYRFHVQEPATELCPKSLCGERTRKETGARLRSLAHDLRVVGLHLLLPQDLEDDLPAVDNTFEDFGGDAGAPKSSGRASSGIPERAFEERGAQFERFLSGIGDSRAPTLDFLHLALPHWPWQLLPTGRQYPTDIAHIPGIEGNAWGDNRFLALQGEQRYLLQLAYVDRLVGRLVDRLRGQGLWDRAVVVVTADHGVSFRSGQPRRLATPENFPDIASVPMFIKAPGQAEGRVDDSPVRTIDVLPTIADLLELRSEWDFDGRSARDGISGRSTVGVMSGELVSTGFEEFKRARDAEVLRRTRLFGSGDAGAGLFRVGVNPDLLGARPAALPPAAGQGMRAELDDLELLRDVDLRSTLLPALVGGRLTGGSAGTPLAIALNGRIEATVPAYRDRGELRFGALLPPRAFRQGRNEVGLYEIASGGRALAPIAYAGAPAGPTGRLQGVGADTELEAGGRRLEIDPDAATGFLEKATAPDPGHVSLSGWAADPRGKARIERVLVFADGRLLASVRPDVPRLDIAARFGRPTLFSGYRLSTVLTDAQEAVGDPGRLRVFAVLDGRAAELDLLGAVRQDQG